MTLVLHTLSESMISFTCDYTEGAHPNILKRLSETNWTQVSGYGDDEYSQSARERICRAVGCPRAQVYFLVGGTQTNATVIDALLPHYAAVIAADSGHIAVHESGAIESSGHKVITLPAHEGKLEVTVLAEYLHDFYKDPTWEHMAIPRMVYISFPTEWGTIYSKEELKRLYALCKEYELLLYVDGARLGYGLVSPTSDLSLEELAQSCDVFYIGGTKIGALCGEAVVFPLGNAPQHIFSIIKQHGALLAKGRLLGLQFDELFTNDLYLQISRNAVERAMQLRELFSKHTIPLYINSPTNQQFPILTKSQIETLRTQILFEVWNEISPNRFVTRFTTSWATTHEQLKLLESALSML